MVFVNTRNIINLRNVSITWVFELNVTVSNSVIVVIPMDCVKVVKNFLAPRNKGIVLVANNVSVL